MLSLITGANGFVGNHVTRFLIERGEQVRALVRPQSDRRLLEGLPVEIACGDLRNAASLSAALSGVQRVYHVAADYRLWAKNPQEIYDSNVGGTRNLLAAAREAGIERFVFTSSVGTIVPPHPEGLPDENTRLHLADMIGHYKRSKLLAEEEAQKAAREGQPVVIVNPTTPVGPGDWKPTPTGQVIVDFLNGKIPAYVDTGLNFVAVEDVAKGHWLAAENGQIGERYILGDRNLTLKEFLDVLARLSGRPRSRMRVPHALPYAAALADSLISKILRREPSIPLEGVRMARHKMFVNGAKAHADLGYSTSGLEAALELAICWYSDRGYLKVPILYRQETPRLTP